MPSTFETLFTTDAAPDMADMFGRDAVYKGPSGAEVDGFKVRLLNERPTPQAVGDNNVSVYNRQADLKVRKADLAAPAKNGRFTVDGVIWTVISLPVLRNGQWIMDVGATPLSVIAERRAERG